MKRRLNAAKSDKEKQSISTIIECLYEDGTDTIIPVEVPFNSKYKDGDRFTFSNEEDAPDTNNLTDSREKVSMDELSSEKVMNCSAASNDIPDAPYGDKKADLSCTLK